MTADACVPVRPCKRVSVNFELMCLLCSSVCASQSVSESVCVFCVCFYMCMRVSLCLSLSLCLSVTEFLWPYVCINVYVAVSVRDKETQENTEI
jgi:hypothetical protein